MRNFVNLHVQTHYSVLRAVPTLSELIDTVISFNQFAIALTDLNSLHMVPELRRKTLGTSVKPLFGLKLEIMSKSRFSLQKKGTISIPSYTVVLLAKNYSGYQNLIKLSSYGYHDGSFGRFCMDNTLLERHRDDLIMLSSDFSGEIRTQIQNKNLDKAEASIDFYASMFGVENFFIELYDDGSKICHEINQTLISIAKKKQLNLVATNPVKYLNPDDHKLLDTISCIRDKTLLSEYNSKLPHSFYFKSFEQIQESFKDIPEAIENTMKIAERCNVIFPEREDQSPIYSIPKDLSSESFLREKSFTGLKNKLGLNPNMQYISRLESELEIVCRMGFPNYFLVVSDFVQYAKKIGILVGPGRGSAAGSLLSYCLDITSVDPLKYDLLFERFLNPERISMPDIDIDFEDERRDEVKEYLRIKYGADRTSDVITFGNNKSKAVIKDVGRVLDIPLSRVTQIANLLDPNADLAYEVEKISAIQTILSGNNKKEKMWIDYSVKLANRIRNLGSHASALIISNDKLDTIVPLLKDKSNNTVTGFEGKYLEDFGLLKIDILGLSNLSIIKHCLENIRKKYHIDIDIDKISLEDPKVFEMFTSGHTAGIFQFESSGMKHYIKQLKPSCIEDLIAMNALYRPGPMDSIPNFIRRKHGLEPINCFHKTLEPILQKTYGVIVYQEQVMQIAQILSGFSLAEADNVRRIMAKKQAEELKTIRPKWINGAKERNYDPALAEELFELLIPFSNYAFNKSHAVAYSILAYQIAWLKAHYPAEFIVALLNSNMDKHDDILRYTQEAKAFNIPILLPDINKSYFKFVSEEHDGKTAIRYGFGGIKGIGEQCATDIITERMWGGNYSSIEDFVERSQSYEIRKNATELLIKAGSFDNLFDPNTIMQEKAIYLNTKNINTLYSKFEQKEDKEKSFNLFSSEEIEAATHLIQRTGITPLSYEEDFQNEIKVFGFYLTQKLFFQIKEKFGYLSTYRDALKEILPSETIISFVGYVTDMQIHRNKQNPYRSWGRFTLQTESENISFVVFGDKLSIIADLKEHIFIFIKSRITSRKEKRSYELLEVFPLSISGIPPQYNFLSLILNNNICSEQDRKTLEELQSLSRKAYREKGAHIFLKFYLISENNIISITAPEKFRISYPSKELDSILNKNIINSYWLS